MEIHPVELAGEGPEREAKRLADTFNLVLELAAAVVFVDEVEDLASARREERRLSAGVTNEFLKQLPRFQKAPHHLLVCATNSIARLDAAFPRPGRFDSVIPVGPPDTEARAAIWQRYVEGRGPARVHRRFPRGHPRHPAEPGRRDDRELPGRCGVVRAPVTAARRR